MDFNAGIIDQRIRGMIAQHPEWFPWPNDEAKQRSAAFVLLCMSSCLDMPQEEAADWLTEGGHDAGVDGIHVADVEDGEFVVTIFQGKYKQRLDGVSNFPESGVQKAVNTAQALFDPNRPISMNPILEPIVEDIRSLVREGYIPNIRMILCNNGQPWKAEAQTWIDSAGFPRDQVQWSHMNHDSIVAILLNPKIVNDKLQFSGEAFVETFDFRRILVGKVQVKEIAELFEKHGDLLLERNIRRFLGTQANRVNSAIERTLERQETRNNFYFFNNGVTIICTKFRHNALQKSDYLVPMENMQIINGGQTCKTIQQTIKKLPESETFQDTHVLVRIYELDEKDRDLVKDITHATNSQNPVDLRDLKSNDDLQKNLEIGINDLGFGYRRQREMGVGGSEILTPAITAEAVLAIWRQNPQQAKFRRKEHFGKLYEFIFSPLNAAQAILAVKIFRFVENRRKRPDPQSMPPFLPYASHYLSMIIGQILLEDLLLPLNQLTHQNLDQTLTHFEEKQTSYHQQAIQKVNTALRRYYGDRDISLQQLSATFRSGYLLEMLQQ